ncbi:unnamed protein product [Caenorhabditis angaria]|uniref:Uncharacterized protein n=1 Tax=Caenorhabditis angaria TaxID=860376 RepID=A0A9P1MUG2_9PELO|nr:unnamed protein product [Caenorhabditis angaria]
MKSSPQKLLILFGLYIIFETTDYDPKIIQELRKIENVPLNCEPVINGSENPKIMDRLKQWTHHFDFYEDKLMEAEDLCSTIHQYFHFTNKSNTQEELDFPLSYGWVVYKDFVQILLQMSILYQPQHLFCLTVDKTALKEYRRVLLELPKCFPNVHVFIGASSDWGSFGILENVYTCFLFLSRQKHEWKYYQYVSGTDLPMKTNLEMVRIFKALNGSINADVDNYEMDRKKRRWQQEPPIPLYKSSMSVAIPREAANYIIKSKKVAKLLRYLSKTWIPDESFWTSISGSPAILPVPGSFRAKDIIWFRKNFRIPESDEKTTEFIGTSYIGRYQLWQYHRNCHGILTSESCVYGVGDIEEIVTRPELVAHKFYLSVQPAAYLCLLKEIRKRTTDPQNQLFDAKSYAEMPTVEMKNGKGVLELTHPDWLTASSFYNPEYHPIDNSKFV